MLDRHVSGPPIEDLIAEERFQSHALGGRSVFGWEPAPDKTNLPAKG